MVGQTKETVIGEPYRKLITADQAAHIENMYSRRLQGENIPTRFETKLLHRDGHAIPVEFNIAIMNFREQPATLAFVRDITEKRQAEQELQEFARQQRLLNEITHSGIEAASLDETLSILSSRLTDLLYADHCSIILIDSQLQKPVTTAKSQTEKTDSSIPQIADFEKAITTIVLQTGQSLIIEDLHHASHFTNQQIQPANLKSLIALPLIAHEEKLGIIIIAFNEVYRFTSSEISLVEQATNQISLVILNARLLETAHQRAKEAETLLQAGVAVAATLRLDEAIDRILVQFNRVVPYDSASVQLLHDDELEIVGQLGFTKANSVMGMRFPMRGDNPNSIVVDGRQTHIIKDAPQVYAEFNKKPHNHIRGWMGVPLIVQDRLIGMLAVDSKQPDRFTNEHARLATAFAAQVAIALENARLYEETHRLAIFDSLTNLYSRRHFMTLAQQEYQRACRYQHALSIIMLDLDHFKDINDTYGHLAGDQVLRSVAQTCQSNLRETDIIGRYGGEEFVILLPETPGLQLDETTPDETNSASAKFVAARLRQAVANQITQTTRGDIQVTISLGVVELTSACESTETLLDRADTALYIAKQRGRNQFVVWNE